jgi:spermidine synthase
VTVLAEVTRAHREHWRWLCTQPVTVNAQGMRLGDTYTMFFAEADLMARHAAALIAGRSGVDVLEIGLGLGFFAQQLPPDRVASYTAVEVHPGVAAHTGHRVLDHLPFPWELVTAAWQYAGLEGGRWDVIMFDTWPPPGRADADFTRFTRLAARLLRPGGHFGFFASGTTLAPARADALDAHFTTWHAEPYRMPAHLVPEGWTKPTTDFLITTATVEP